MNPRKCGCGVVVVYIEEPGKVWLSSLVALGEVESKKMWLWVGSYVGETWESAVETCGCVWLSRENGIGRR